ncbi:MAG: DNA internalization-related competence protein ComEC/Rec2 [Azoarcus sp.]|jgi:competence protein ComEC|nr:DNA internalization-related competence protein ComEC/Rec2 [Azoarcus sp.]
MCANVFCILFGVWLLQMAAALPSWAGWGWLPALAALAALVVSASRLRRARTTREVAKWRALALAAALLMGYGYAAWRAEARMNDALDPALEGRDLSLVGTVASLPDDNGDGVRFVFAVESVDGEGDVAQGQASSSVPRRVSLSWYRTWGYGERAKVRVVPDLQPGERWRLPVRLRLPHGSANPGGFDYEAWLLERGLRATGNVRGDGERLTADAGGFMNGVHRLRASIRARFAAALPEAPYRGILTALAIGDQNAIPTEQWEILRRTGVQHLVAISGLHVSLVALAVGGFCMALWRRAPWLVLRCPARVAAAVAGLVAAGCYALLAGLGIPVQRALVMLAVAAVAIAARRETGARNVLALALAAVLAFDPWAPLTAGFWLSFGAVAVILLVAGGRVAPPSGWRAATRLQLAITFATVPVLAALFQGFSLVAPLANAFAIPAVSFAIAPLTLLAALLPATWLLELAHTLTTWMMAALAWLSSSPLALHEQALPPPWLLTAATLAALLTILPRGTPGKLAAVAVLGGFFLWQPPRPQSDDFRAAVLDVGQGLAVHVQTATHDFLYDSGPLYGRASDAGERVVAPYLRAMGVTRLDAVAISHDDADHSGGLASVRKRVDVAQVIEGESSGLPACVAGLRWQWDGVDFVVLAPDALPAGKRANAQSCVLRVTGQGGASLLLTGDIESGGEYDLVNRYGATLASSAVVAAHHGSKSSSSSPFVAAVRPQAAIFSAGYRNRYGHPHPQVLSRWQEAGAQNLRTDASGMVSLEAKNGKLETTLWRAVSPRYWHGR